MFIAVRIADRVCRIEIDRLESAMTSGFKRLECFESGSLIRRARAGVESGCPIAIPAAITSTEGARLAIRADQVASRASAMIRLNLLNVFARCWSSYGTTVWSYGLAQSHSLLAIGRKNLTSTSMGLRLFRSAAARTS
jgi:hypothetical protein